MKIYLVGGAVRDKFLNIPNNDKDYVVVGSSPKEMLELGYKQVGNSFPVFLHPVTGEEYALARKEKSTGSKNQDFQFEIENVSIEDDLMRRDLTINAMAFSSGATFIDPFHGYDDLQKKILRHVSDAFAEDPIRILRVARFSAKFPDFSIAPETFLLMKNMLLNGALKYIPIERITLEFQKALKEKEAIKFFDVLINIGGEFFINNFIKIDKSIIDKTKTSKLKDNVLMFLFLENANNGYMTLKNSNFLGKHNFRNNEVVFNFIRYIKTNEVKYLDRLYNNHARDYLSTDIIQQSIKKYNNKYYTTLKNIILKFKILDNSLSKFTDIKELITFKKQFMQKIVDNKDYQKALV